MADFRYEVKKIIGAIEKGFELRVVAWGENHEKYDLRKWYDHNGTERCGKGITFTASEAKELLNILDNIEESSGGKIQQGKNELRVTVNKYGYDISVYNNVYRLKGNAYSLDGIKTLRELLRKEVGGGEEAKTPTVSKVVSIPKRETITKETVTKAAVKKYTTPLKAPSKAELVEDGVVKSLIQIPVNDCNYPINKATEDQLRQAIEIMEKDPDGHHKTRIARCKAKLSQLLKTSKTSKASKIVEMPVAAESEDITEDVNEDVGEDTCEDVNEDGSNEEKATELPKNLKDKFLSAKSPNTIRFPKEDTTKIIKLKPTGEHHTYEEVVAKLAADREKFKGDRDTEFVIDGILAACKNDQELLDNVMRPEKTYLGACTYFANKAKQGFCIRFGNIGIMTAETALKYSIDYFNSEDEKPKKSETKKSEVKKSEVKKSEAKK